MTGLADVDGFKICIQLRVTNVSERRKSAALPCREMTSVTQTEDHHRDVR